MNNSEEHTASIFTSALKMEAVCSFITLVYTYKSTQHCHLGDVVVSVLATGPKGHGFEPGQSNGFLRAIKI
jgi:hypothetical protein